MAKKSTNKSGNLNKQPEVCFVQFVHPGAEHVIPKKYNVKKDFLFPWNYKDHKRKFLETTAQYVDHNNNLQSGEILFWGEWEPDSLARIITPAPANGTDLPRNIHNPLFITDQKGKVLAKPYIINKKGNKVIRQNTDPFVFGNNFYYRLCQQGFTNGQIKNLEPGSIILFGSNRGGSTNPYFALNTVFVVKESRPYSTTTYANDLQGFIPNDYPEEIMGLELWRKCLNYKEYNPQRSNLAPRAKPVIYTCYKGASYSNPIDGMYSFVPCVLSKTNPQGFERIKLTEADFNNIGITIPKKGIFNNKLNQHFKITITNIQDNKKIWDKLRAIVHQQNCLEGVQMDYRHIIVP